MCVCWGLNCVGLYLQTNTCISLIPAVAKFYIMFKGLECLCTLSAYQLVIGILKNKKLYITSISFSGIEVRGSVILRERPRFESALSELFSPFSSLISYRIGKAFIFNKNEGNN